MLNFIKNLFTNQKPEDTELGGKLGEKGELSFKEDEYQLRMGEEEVNRCLTLAGEGFGGVNSPMYNFVKRMIKNFDRTDTGLFYSNAISLRRLLTHSISVKEIENEREFVMQKLDAREAKLKEREAKIVKIEAAQQILNRKIVGKMSTTTNNN
jgi:hypothetical protein